MGVFALALPIPSLYDADVTTASPSAPPTEFPLATRTAPALWAYAVAQGWTAPAYLEERDCVTEQVGPNTIEASRLSSVRHDQARMELDLYLRAWLASHPEAHAEIVD